VAAVVVAPPPLLPLSTVVPVTSHSPRLPGLTPSLPLTPYHPLHSPLHGLTSSLLPILTVYITTTYLLSASYSWGFHYLLNPLSTIVLLPIINTRYIVIYIYTLYIYILCTSCIVTFPGHIPIMLLLLLHGTSCVLYMVSCVQCMVSCVLPMVHHVFSTTIPALLYSVATSLPSLL